MRKHKSFENTIYYTIISIFITSSILIMSYVFSFIRQSVFTNIKPISIRHAVIIDPGHGGKDGGAISVTGSYEKEINLNISLSCKELLNLMGYDVTLTRDSDIELTHKNGGTRKMQDLKGRLEISKNTPDAVFVSIHMNKFPQSKYKGLQVYFSPNNDASYYLAKEIQNNTVKYLQQDNYRKVKPATSSIYLLDKITAPSVLVECGFLSNEEEARLLDSNEYQVLLASIIASSINSWYNA